MVLVRLILVAQVGLGLVALGLGLVALGLGLEVPAGLGCAAGSQLAGSGPGGPWSLDSKSALGEELQLLLLASAIMDSVWGLVPEWSSAGSCPNDWTSSLRKSVSSSSSVSETLDSEENSTSVSVLEVSADLGVGLDGFTSAIAAGATDHRS